jgi:hypothetical protein
LCAQQKSQATTPVISGKGGLAKVEVRKNDGLQCLRTLMNTTLTNVVDWHVIEHRHSIGRAVLGRRGTGFARRAKLAGRNFQFPSQDSHVTGRVQSQRHAVAGNPPDLQYDVVTYVNPFTDLSA